MSFAYEVMVAGKWYPNKVYFATEQEATQAALNKLWSWTQCQDTRVVPHEEEANYRLDFDSGSVLHIATEGASK